MASTTTNGTANRLWIALFVALALCGLAALWSCATKEFSDLGTLAERPDVIKTTIRISKGRPGAMSQWEVGIETEKESSKAQYGKGAVIPLEVWKRMNGTITSFVGFTCKGTPQEVEELTYETTGGEVLLKRQPDSKPKWDFDDCNQMNADCRLPDRYFAPVKEDATTCEKEQPERVWVMELK